MNVSEFVCVCVFMRDAYILQAGINDCIFCHNDFFSGAFTPPPTLNRKKGEGKQALGGGSSILYNIHTVTVL